VIIEVSAAGKSILAKVIVGVWQASSDSIRLDESNIYT
jgi:ABC-type protease/lipase transport system fused ATPase/permease subunit